MQIRGGGMAKALGMIQEVASIAGKLLEYLAAWLGGFLGGILCIFAGILIPVTTFVFWVVDRQSLYSQTWFPSFLYSTLVGLGFLAMGIGLVALFLRWLD